MRFLKGKKVNVFNNVPWMLTVALAKEGGVGRRFTLCALLHAVGSQIESNRMSFKR